MISISMPLSPLLTPPTPYLTHLHTARTRLYRTLSPLPSPPPEHQLIPPVPNLELHSAAAEGNVGLVHYALTHGQPVNSVLHGVQPIHAAAAGGSVGAIRMLIDRGADVNAPRLPRRYSNEKKRGAPSLGAAGATPLHFAAANGHASIVQILLTCGAAPEKTDKLGQTAESLAEANGHDEVLRVLQVYDHLQRQDSQTFDAASLHGENAQPGPSSARTSPHPSSQDLPPQPVPNDLNEEDPMQQLPISAAKGKERAMSVSSQRSDTGGMVKFRKSLDGLFGRRSRKNSAALGTLDKLQIGSPIIPPVPPVPSKLSIRIDEDVQAGVAPDVDGMLDEAQSDADGEDGVEEQPQRDNGEEHIAHNGTDGEDEDEDGRDGEDEDSGENGAADRDEAGNEANVTLEEALEELQDPPINFDDLDWSRTPDVLPFPPSRASSIHQASPRDASPNSTHDLALAPSISPGLSPMSPSLQPTVSPGISSEVGSLGGLSRINSRGSQISNSSNRSNLLSPNSSVTHLAPPPREHRTSHSSRRPSLPSILEKAVHPGQAFRQALRKEQQTNENVRFSPEVSPVDHEAPRSVSGHSFFHRGRVRSNESAISSGSSTGSQTLSGAQEKSRRYMTRNAFIGLFRRSNSPPSRSPSPPAARRSDRPIDAQELEDGIERLKRASLDLDRQERQSLDDERPHPDSSPESRPPKSAPVTRTRFFEDLSPNPPPIPEGLLYGIRSPSPPSSPILPYVHSIPGRPRKGSEVIAPSPLANEWARESSDSDTTAPAGVRRARTEGSRNASKLSQSSGATSPRGNKQRSATLPSGGYSRPSAPTRTGSASRLVTLDLDDGADLRSGVLRRESAKKRGDVDDGEVEDEREELEDTEDSDREEVFHDAEADLPEDAGDTETINSPGPDEAPPVPSPPAKLSAGRYRGASIGSMNSQTSRISSSGSNVRFSNAPSDDGSSDRRARYLAEYRNNASQTPSSAGADTRPRGKSVSSIATTTSGSGMGFSYTHSTPATSLTPPSTLSITLGSAFPPVPEHDIPGHPALGMSRRFSSRQEAAKAIKQQEDDVLQLAQLPTNEHSSRDLAAQLALYGDSYAMEQELAEYERLERRERREARGSGGRQKKGTKFEIDDGTESSIGSIGSRSESFVSARSGLSALDSTIDSSVHRGSITSSTTFDRPPPSLISVEAPKTSVPNINSIYDRRANMYREKMQALTSAQTSRPPSVAPSKNSDRHRRHRALTTIESRPTGPPAWLTGAGDDRAGGRTEISASLPAGSLPVQPPGQGLMAGANTPKPHRHRDRKDSFNRVPASIASTSAPRSPPPPIADIIQQRYQGLATAPSSYTPRASSVLAQTAAAPRHVPRSSAQQPVTALPPPVSIFSHRFAGPHDGGDSDDSEHEATGYTMIENDWRGGRVLNPGDLGPEGLAKRGKWGFKGPFSKRGR